MIHSTVQPLLIYPTELYKTVQVMYLHGTQITDGICNIQEGRISNLNDPIGPKDAVNKQYLETHSGGTPGGPLNSLQFKCKGNATSVVVRIEENSSYYLFNFFMAVLRGIPT